MSSFWDQFRPKTKEEILKAIVAHSSRRKELEEEPKEKLGRWRRKMRKKAAAKEEQKQRDAILQLAGVTPYGMAAGPHVEDPLNKHPLDDYVFQWDQSGIIPGFF
jgi:hypothetical protein